jgi:uncharacterized membrane-anchored protein/membrane protein DedA with SNARE-associated domain
MSQPLVPGGGLRANTQTIVPGESGELVPSRWNRQLVIPESDGLLLKDDHEATRIIPLAWAPVANVFYPGRGAPPRAAPPAPAVMNQAIAFLSPTGFVSSSGYAAIFVLSVLQSCCVPTSSELTMGFAGVLASQGALSLPGAIAAGAGGELVGGYIAWAIGRAGGRPLVERYGRYVLLSPRDLDRAEAWYQRHERFGVLASRLLPVIRNFVAVPAGVARVPALRFGVLTAIGSLIWDGAMALIGYGVGGQWRTVMKGFSDAGYLLGALALLALAFVIWHRWRSYHADMASSAAVHLHAGPGTAAANPGQSREVVGLTELWRRLGAKSFATVKVPALITAAFWVIKLLSTAMGESVSDALVYGIDRYAAVLLGLVLFVAAMAWQLKAQSYSPLRYWAAVCMVAVFGTMAADVLHIGLHIPYAVSSTFYAVCLAVVLTIWYRTEGTLSIHSITTVRREGFYWLTVLCTFALGTAVGDLTAKPLNLGYLGSGLMFAGLFAVPGLIYGVRRSNAVATFWSAYILTRPFGASFADWLGFGKANGGLGLGHPLAALVFAVPIVALVAYVAASKVDAPRPGASTGPVTAPVHALRLPHPPTPAPSARPAGAVDLMGGETLQSEPG